MSYPLSSKRLPKREELLDAEIMLGAQDADPPVLHGAVVAVS